MVLWPIMIAYNEHLLTAKDRDRGTKALPEKTEIIAKIICKSWQIMVVINAA